MKWIGGAILLIITIVLILVAIFMFPWFITKTTYHRDIINKDPNTEYWDTYLGGVERDWDESTYYLQQYELKSSRPWNWGKNNSKESSSTGMLQYNSPPNAGGWDGSYRNMVEAGYPPPGFISGGSEQLTVFNFTYYMMIGTIILACIAIIFVILAGLEKISVTLPKVFVIITIVFVILGPLYFALGLPPAIDTDNKEYYNVLPLDQKVNTTYQKPAEADGIMGTANEKDESTTKFTSTTDFQPGIGWWLSVAAIFTTIITIAFVTGPAPASASPPDYSRRKYHEFDRPYEREGRYERHEDREYGPAGRRRAYDQKEGWGQQATQDYYEPPQRRRDQYAYDERQYPPDYGRGAPPARRAYDSRESRRPAEYPEYPRRRAPPQYDYDYGRPPPSRRPRDYTPPPSRSRRRPPVQKY